jgi:sulfoxide reductase heme-binding subunit YedZ
MAWLQSNWRWATLNLAAVCVAAILLTQGSTDWSTTEGFDLMLESGKWAIRFLLVCLSMTPLHRYFGWSSAVQLRKPAGLWAFEFAVLHVLAYIREARFTWLEFTMPPFIVLGVLGLLILSALAVTSNRWAMRRLRKTWKRLHRLVYLAGNLVVFHAILATTMSKRIPVRDPHAVQELSVYLALLVVLLVVRIPLVRRALVQNRLLLRRRHEADRPVLVPIKIPDSRPDYGPKANGREADIDWDELLAEIQSEEVDSEKVIVG